MAKTRRKKINGKAPLKSRNIVLASIGTLVVPGRKGKPERSYPNAVTGVNRGKTYPYAGKNRGGRGGGVAAFEISPRQTVAVVD